MRSRDSEVSDPHEVPPLDLRSSREPDISHQRGQQGEAGGQPHGGASAEADPAPSGPACRRCLDMGVWVEPGWGWRPALGWGLPWTCPRLYGTPGGTRSPPCLSTLASTCCGSRQPPFWNLITSWGGGRRARQGLWGDTCSFQRLFPELPAARAAASRGGGQGGLSMKGELCCFLIQDGIRMVKAGRLSGGGEL